MFGFLKRHTMERPPLQFHNTLSGKLEIFEPLNHTVRMYNCGPTPYDEQHIGNMVPAYLGNLLRRTLESWGYRVDQVTNITDFGHLSGDNEGNADIGEDRMSRGLKREGWEFTMVNMRRLAEKYTEIFLHDIESLGVPTNKIKFPRASEYIKEEIALVEALEEKGYTYLTSDGVYFDTKKFVGYGKLGGLAEIGPTEARIEANNEKKNPRDFALWKFSTRGNKLGWESPWGRGFPGWHIECTAMIFSLLGKQIDIHTGGIEHIPVHHNNEIAQAEALTGKQFVRYWMHNAHITIESKKISKSLGNTVYLRQLVDRGLSPRALRYWFLTGHYRTPMNFTWDAIEGANTALGRLQHAYLELRPSSLRTAASDKKFLKEFYEAIADDLNTPRALALLWDAVKNKSISQVTAARADQILGLGLAERGKTIKLELTDELQQLLHMRKQAREKKEFAQSDELRTRIEALGYEVKDTPQGQEITLKK